jgi:ribose 5-phosphate isomerase A
VPLVNTPDDEKRLAAEAAAELVESGMTIGLGTGSTVAHLLPAIARRGLTEIRCVATSVGTEQQARDLGVPVEEFDRLQRLDIAIDGTDEVTPDGWLIKGGGGAHLREKIVAAAAERFVVICDSCAARCHWSCSASAPPRRWRDWVARSSYATLPPPPTGV